jgi:hypothetical protein
MKKTEKSRRRFSLSSLTLHSPWKN